MAFPKTRLRLWRGGREMIRPNWSLFESKFPDYEDVFEWFVTLLFCRELDVKIPLEGYFNQAAIEKNPVYSPDEKWFVGFQAKYYKDSISKHKTKILESITNTNKYYPSVKKYYFYTNAEWGQSKGKTPKGKIDIETYARKLGIEIEWRTTESFFKNEFVCLTNEDISEYFFTLENSFLENLKYFYDHTKQLFLNIDYRIQKKNKIIQIDRSKELQEFNDKSKNTFVIHGEGGCGKSALIKKFIDDNPKYIFLGMKAIELNNCNDLKETLHNCLPEKLSRFFNSYDNKYFIIDSAEKLLDISDNNVFFQLIKYLTNNKWRIIFSTRDSYFEPLLAELSYTLGLSPVTISIPILKESKLKELLEKNEIQIPSDNKLMQLICNPFYLKYYIQFYSEELRTLDYHNFKKTLWNSYSSVTSDFINISAEKAKKGQFYINSEKISKDILNRLLANKLITKDDNNYFIAHDIFEEWALEKYLDSLFANVSSFDEFLLKMGDSLPIRRSYSHWLSDKISNDDSLVITYAIDFIRQNIKNQNKIQETIIAIMLSNKANVFFDNLEVELLEDDYYLLKYVQKKLRIACKSLDEEWMKIFHFEPSSHSLALFFTCPKGVGWDCFINYVYNKKNVIGVERIPVFFPLFKDWTNKNRHGIATKQASLLTLKFYQWEQVQKDHWKYSDVENDAFLIISNGANEIKEELSDLFDEILKNKWKEHNDRYSKFIWEILRDNKYSTIWCVLPDKVLELAELYWTRTPIPKENPFYLSYTHSTIDDQYGVEGHYMTGTFPSSALHTPILMLLLIEYDKTIDFIISFFNKCTKNYISNNPNSVKEINFSIEGKEIRQYANDTFWNMFRGVVGTTPNLLQCILMALEDYFIENLKNENITVMKEKLIYILEHSETVTLSAVVCSIVLFRYKDLYSIGKILLSVKDFIEMDFIRSHHENQAKTEQEFRRKSLQEIAYLYQFKMFEEESEDDVKIRQNEIYALLDKYYSELPSEELQSDDDKIFKFRLAAMDGRKREVKPLIVDGKECIALYPVISKDLEKYKQEKDKQIFEDMPHLSLSNWINYTWKKDKKVADSDYTKNPALVIKEIKELEAQLKTHRPIRKEMFSPLDENTFWYLNHTILPTAAACIIRDFQDSITIDDLTYCKNIVISFATLPFNKNYSFQFGDGVNECISVLPILLSRTEFPQEYCRIKTILLLNLLLISSSDIQHKELLLTSLKENLSTDELLIFIEKYLCLISCWQEYYFKVRNQVYYDSADINVSYIDDFIENQSDVFQKYHSSLFENYSKIDYDKLTIDAIANSLFLIREDCFSKKEFLMKVIERSFYALQENEQAQNKDFSNSSFLIETLTKLLLLVPKEEAKDYLKIFIDNLNNQDFYEDLLKNFIYAENDLKKLDNFWSIWELFFQKIVEVFTSRNGRKNSKILKAYLFNSVQWNEKAKDWHSFTTEKKLFFQRIGNALKSYENMIDYFSFIIYGPGSLYLNDGITWLAIIVRNFLINLGDYYENYYLEQIMKKYIYENLDEIRSNGIRKQEVLDILNYLIEKDSVTGYMLRDSVL